MLRRLCLACGIVASLLYVGIDVLAAMRYPEYHSFTSRVISELMANGAPTERLVDPLFLIYDALMIAFGAGVWMSSDRKQARVTGGLLVAYAAIGMLGPTVFEMNVRGAGGDPRADTLHLALTGVVVLFIFASVGFGASLRGWPFRFYSLATMLLMLLFGGLTSLGAHGLETGEPTPWLGAMERLNIGVFLLWVGVLAVSLLRAHGTSSAGADVGFQATA